MGKGIETLLHRFYDEVVSSGNVELIDEICTSDFLDHAEPPPYGTVIEGRPPGLPEGPEGLKARIRMYRDAIPDLTVSVEDILVDGDRVATRGILTGTQKGEFMGIAPTRRNVQAATIDVVRVVDDRIAEHWGLTDWASLMQQIGAIPTRA